MRKGGGELVALYKTGSAYYAPAAAAMLNLTEDHFDRYASLDEYGAAKARIFRGAALQVLNRDDPRSAAMAQAGKPLITFGLDAPRSETDVVVAAGTLVQGRQALVAVDELALRGSHNVANALAACALVSALGVESCAGLKTFRGLPHRLQLVATRRGVEWYDDSKGTNVGATVAALKGLGRKAVLILGGEGHKVGQDPDTRRRYEALETFARKRFPVVEITHRWSAQDFVPADQVPYIGPLAPRSKHRFVATGFKKWGMTHATVAAMILRDLIAGRPNPGASLYDSTRLKPKGSLGSLVGENANVAKRFVGDRIATLRPPAADRLAPGEGGVCLVEVDAATPGGPGTLRTIRYTAGTHPTHNAQCGNRPEWHGQVCLQTPAAQPAVTADVPGLLTTHTVAYDLYLGTGRTVSETVVEAVLKGIWEHVDKLAPIHPVLAEWTRERAPRIGELAGLCRTRQAALLAEGGVDRVSMRAVAERVGVSATAIYHYFQGKQDLIERVVRVAFERFGAYLEAAMRRHPTRGPSQGFPEPESGPEFWSFLAANSAGRSTRALPVRPQFHQTRGSHKRRAWHRASIPGCPFVSRLYCISRLPESATVPPTAYG